MIGLQLDKFLRFWHIICWFNYALAYHMFIIFLNFVFALSFELICIELYLHLCTLAV